MSTLINFLRAIMLTFLCCALVACATTPPAPPPVPNDKQQVIFNGKTISEPAAVDQNAVGTQSLTLDEEHTPQVTREVESQHIRGLKGAPELALP